MTENTKAHQWLIAVEVPITAEQAKALGEDPGGYELALLEERRVDVKDIFCGRCRLVAEESLIGGECAAA